MGRGGRKKLFGANGGDESDNFDIMGKSKVVVGDGAGGDATYKNKDKVYKVSYRLRPD